MRTRPTFLASLVLVVSVAGAVAACGGESTQTTPAAVPTATAAPVQIVSFTKAPESGTVDKVGTVDGNFRPDQTPDLVFDLTVQGPVKALFVVSVDRQGRPNKKFRADTLVKEQEAPEELGGTLEQGSFSAGIGVYENEKLVNDGDGALILLAPGAHTLKLYVNRLESPGTGGRVRVYAIGADDKLVTGPVVDY